MDGECDARFDGERVIDGFGKFAPGAGDGQGEDVDGARWLVERIARVEEGAGGAARARGACARTARTRRGNPCLLAVRNFPERNACRGEQFPDRAVRDDGCVRVVREDALDRVEVEVVLVLVRYKDAIDPGYTILRGRERPRVGEDTERAAIRGAIEVDKQAAVAEFGDLHIAIIQFS